MHENYPVLGSGPVQLAARQLGITYRQTPVQALSAFPSKVVIDKSPIHPVHSIAPLALGGLQVSQKSMSYPQAFNTHSRSPFASKSGSQAPHENSPVTASGPLQLPA